MLADLVLLAAEAEASSGSGIDVANPLVLGPIAGFVFIIFVMEVVVSGKAYRREVEENIRLRTLTEKVVPLAESMVTTTKDLADVTKEVTRVMDTVVDLLEEKNVLPPSVTRRRR